MSQQTIIPAASATKSASPTTEIHKIHTLEPSGAANGATPQCHSTLISKWFALHSSPHFPATPLPHLPPPPPGQILLITGPSGSGKSTLLRRLRRRWKLNFIDIPRIALFGKAVIDHFHHITIESALAHLSRVGLAEAHCYLLSPRNLSDGQRWRLRLAIALSHDSDQSRCCIGDEFTSLLDPITAAVVARVLRRAISPESNLCALLACSRTDILRALRPDLILRCNFGKLQLWKNTKGEDYVLEGETSQASKLHSRPPHPQTRQPR